MILTIAEIEARLLGRGLSAEEVEYLLARGADLQAELEAHLHRRLGLQTISETLRTDSPWRFVRVSGAPIGSVSVADVTFDGSSSAADYIDAIYIRDNEIEFSWDHLPPAMIDLTYYGGLDTDLEENRAIKSVLMDALIRDFAVAQAGQRGVVSSAVEGTSLQWTAAGEGGFTPNELRRVSPFRRRAPVPAAY